MIAQSNRRTGGYKIGAPVTESKGGTSNIMKKPLRLLLLALLLPMLLLSTAAGALANSYDFPDVTDVEAWRGNAPRTSGSWVGWFDVIGDEARFQTFGATLTDNNLTIFTNWGPDDVGFLGSETADLFLDIRNTGSWTHAVNLNAVLTAGGPGNFVADILAITSSPQTSQELFAGTGLIYGGRYDEADPKPVPVLAAGEVVGQAAVIWAALAAGESSHSIAIALGHVPGFDARNFAFLWGTATCGNDTMTGVVPLPGTVLLLGLGLLGLVGLGFRRRP
jgi:hypothetical protein